jgi:hypothetical protein
MSRSAQSTTRRDGVRVSLRVYPRAHGELHAELLDLAPDQRGPRLLFLAQLGLLVRASIAARGLLAPGPTSAAASPNPSSIPQEVQDRFRNVIAELDLSGFSST